MKLFTLLGSLLLSVFSVQQAQAAIALDRTRVVFDGAAKSVSLNVSNENKSLPYLAQGWLEDKQGNKVTSPLMVVPPLQRLEAGSKSQVKIQSSPQVDTLPQDHETLFYFNLREIPPKSNKPNTLQLALQTRIKLFFRPKALVVTSDMKPFQEQITLSKIGEKYQVNNPTGYYVTIIDASSKKDRAGDNHFEPIMISPKGSKLLNEGASVLGTAPVLTYINDFGGRPQLQFTCNGSNCKATPIKAN